MSGIKRWAGESLGWVEVSENPESVKCWNGTEWVDGTSNNPVTINTWSGDYWVQMFPEEKVEVGLVLESSNVCYINTGSNYANWTQNRCNGGTYNGLHYTGWTGIKSPLIADIEKVNKVTCDYIRRGVGESTKPLHLSFSHSTLTSPNVNGSSAHNSKKTTFTSDNKMVACPATGQTASGVVEFTSEEATNAFKNWLATNQSLVVGTKANNTDYISVDKVVLNIDYTTTAYLAKFNNSNTNTSTKGKTVEMLILKDEIGMSLEDILKRREELNINITF